MPSNLLPNTETTPEAVAVSSADGSYTWADLESRARRFAAGLVAEGLAVGDRWALLAQNRIEWTPMVLGNLRAGNRYVPCNWHLTADEVAYQLADSESRLLVVDTANEEVGREAAAAVGVDRIIVIDTELEAWLATQADVEPPEDEAVPL